jgi:hypothetical protein
MSNSKKSKRNNSEPTPIIESPDGVRIQVTQGNKLKFITAVQSAPKAELSDLQKRLYFHMIDKTNEGFGNDTEKYGYAYPNFQTLAKACACSERAAKENIAALETGIMNGHKLRDGSKGADKIIPDRWRIKVKRESERSKGGAGNVNRYWLPLWNEFGAVDGKGASHSPSKLVSIVGAGSFIDEANGESISTFDCMSKRQQFAFVSQFYQRKLNRPVASDDWEAFREASDRASLELMIVNIGEAGPGHSFSDCVSAKIYNPPNEYDPAEWDDSQHEDGDLGDDSPIPF